MNRLINNIYLIPKGFRRRKLIYTFQPNEYSRYDDFIQNTYIRLFWRFYKLVRITVFHDVKRPFPSFVNKFNVR